MMRHIRTFWRHFDTPHHDSVKISKLFLSGDGRNAFTLSRQVSSSSSPSSSRSSFLPLLTGFVSGVVFGGAAGFLAGKYPFVSSKVGFKQTPEKFISRPNESRVKEGDEEVRQRLDKTIKACEAMMKIAEIAILSTIGDEKKLDSVENVESPDSELVYNDLSPSSTVSRSLPHSATTKQAIQIDLLSSSHHHVYRPESRPVCPFPADPGIPFVHFSTNRFSRKFDQIKSNPEVSLTYLDKGGAGYVTIKGTAEILGPGESAALWRDELVLFYPEGPPSASSPSSRFVVVKIHPRRMEFCSSRFGLESAHESWLPLALEFKDGKWTQAKENKVL